MRIDDANRAAAEAALEAGGAVPDAGTEVKRPGDAEWVKPFDLRDLAKTQGRMPKDANRYQEIVNVLCPDGKPATQIHPD